MFHARGGGGGNILFGSTRENFFLFGLRNEKNSLLRKKNHIPPVYRMVRPLFSSYNLLLTRKDNVDVCCDCPPQRHLVVLTCSASHPMCLISVLLLGTLLKTRVSSLIACCNNICTFECKALNHCMAMCSSGHRNTHEFLPSGEYSSIVRCWGSGTDKFRHR